jgi:hypothetical protein
MLDISKVKLGKKPAKLDPRTLQLAKYFTPSLPSPPSAVDYTMGIKSFGLMLNDQLGCCTIAAIGHAEQIWSAARGGEYTLPDAAILQKYEEWCGYNPSDPNSDQGGVEIDVLNDWRQQTIWKHPLTAYADPNPRNLEHVKQAINLFGGVYIGVALPLSAQGLNIWDAASGPDGVPDSWGGHAIFVPKYRTGSDGKVTFTCVSWGELIDITQDFWMYNDPQNGPYVDEVHALIAPEFLSLKTGKTPEGFDLTTLLADRNLVTN